MTHFNLRSEVPAHAAGLQEIVTLFPGTCSARRPVSASVPSLSRSWRTGATGGTVPFSDLVQQSFMGISGINPRRRHDPTGSTYTLAARLFGQPTGEAKTDATKDADKKKDEKSPPPAKINVIAIAGPGFDRRTVFQYSKGPIARSRTSNSTTFRSCSTAWTSWLATSRLSACDENGRSTDAWT